MMELMRLPSRGRASAGGWRAVPVASEAFAAAWIFMARYFVVPFKFVSVFSRWAARTSVKSSKLVEPVHEYGPTCTKVSPEDVGLGAPPKTPVEMEPLLAVVIVAVAEMDGRFRAEVDDVAASGMESDRLFCRLSIATLSDDNTGLTPVFAASLPVNWPLLRLAVDIGTASDGLLMLLLSNAFASPNCTGQKLHTRRVMSQNKSSSNLRNPTASKFEKHLAAAISS